MKNVKADYGFNIKEDSNGCRITYNKAKYSIGSAFAFLGAGFMLAIALSLIFHKSDEMLIVIWAVLLAGPIIMPFVLNKMRTPGEFIISGKSFIVSDNEYARADISNIYVKDKRGGTQLTAINSGTGAFIGGTGAVGVAAAGAAAAGQALQASSQAAGRAIRNAIEKVNVKICFTFGEKEIVLAKGLNQQRAEVLFNKLLEILEEN